MTNYPEYTLSRPPSCPTNQDHLNKKGGQVTGKGTNDEH